MLCQGTTKHNKTCKRNAMQNGCCHQHGGSISSFLRKRVKALIEGPAKKPSSRLDSFLDKNQKIVAIKVARKPINGIVHKTLDAVSGGRFSKAANYDSVWHSYLLVTLDDGKTVRLEKNHIIEEKPAEADDFRQQSWDIPLNGRELTVKGMMNNASKGHEADFYRYKAGSNNCQKFARDMIEKNQLMPPTEAVALQNAQSLVDTVPLPVNLITDAAAVGDRLYHGDGVIKTVRKVKQTKYTNGT